MQKNIVPTKMTVTSGPNNSKPRKTLLVQMRIGRQIPAIEAETQKECKRCRMPPLWYIQSAIAILAAPRAAASNCIIKICTI